VKKFSLSIIIAIIVVGSFTTSRAIGIPDVTTLTATCTTAQSILNQIQKADVGSRINRGHDYNEILDLMFAMNARLAANKIAAPTLTDLASIFKQNLVKFRADYDSYDDALSSALEIKCTSWPVDFYHKLETTRIARELLWQDVTTLDQNIDNYYAQFDIIIKEAKLW